MKKQTNIVRYDFQQYVNTAMASGSLTSLLEPSLIGGTQIYTAYELYRYVKLEYMLLQRPNGTTDSLIAMGFYPDATITAPSSLGNAMENIDAIIQSDVATVCTPWHSVPPTRLKGQLEWYKSQPDAAASEFEAQGTIAWTGTAVETVNCLIRGTLEFKNPVDSGTAIKRFKEQARAEVLRDLASGVQTAVGSKSTGNTVGGARP